MARTVKPAHERRAEILDAAQALFFEHGFEGTSVHQIIVSVGISKGAFYHHFRSKDAILNQLAERLAEQGVEALRPLVEHPNKSALEKFQAFWTEAQGFKKTHVVLMRQFMKVFYKDENLRLRMTLQAHNVARTRPLLSTIIAQGVAEGVMQSRDPDVSADVILHMGLRLSEVMVAALQTKPASGGDVLAARIRVYEDAIARTLGLPDGALTLLDPSFIRALLEGEAEEE